MPMAKRKIDLMHKMFGKTEQVCKNCDHFLCDHFLRGRYRDRVYRKCEVYGVTSSEASDWNAFYQACGLFNKPYPYEGNPIIHCVTPDRKAEVDNEPLEGQLDLLGGDAE